MNIHQLAHRIKNQADRLFPSRTDQSMFLKVYSEMGELVSAPDDPEEFADLMIMLLDYGARKGFAIEYEVKKKMALNETRVWKQNENGVFQHVKQEQQILGLRP